MLVAATFSRADDVFALTRALVKAFKDRDRHMEKVETDLVAIASRGIPLPSSEKLKSYTTTAEVALSTMAAIRAQIGPAMRRIDTIRAEREQLLAPVRAAAQVQRDEAERSIFKQVKEVELKVGENLNRMKAAYAIPRELQEPTRLSVSTMPGSGSLAMDSPSHDHVAVNSEVEKLLAMARASKASTPSPV